MKTMEQKDTKRKYKAVGCKLTCNIRDVEMVFATDKISKQFEKRMNRAVRKYRGKCYD